MKNIKISILCAMIIATAIYCPEPTDNQKNQPQNATVDQTISDPKKTLSTPDAKPLTISERLHNFTHQRITVKEGVSVILACAIVWVVGARVKSAFFSSDEPQKIRDTKNSSLDDIFMSLNILNLFVQNL